MPRTASVNLDHLTRVIGEAYRREGEANTLGSIFEEYNLSGNVTFARDTFNDGEISAPFIVQYESGTTIQGKLRFTERGDIEDGVKSRTGIELEDNGSVIYYTPISAESARFLIALAFGSDELKTAFSEKDAKLFEGARVLYRCYESGAKRESKCFATAQAKIDDVRRNENNERTTELVLFANKMLETAKSEDKWGIFDPWDPNQFSGIVDQQARLIGALPSDTLESSTKRLELANDMILKSLATYSGVAACLKLGRCETRVSREDCTYTESHDHHSDALGSHDVERKGTRSIQSYLFNGQEVNEDRGGCSK